MPKPIVLDASAIFAWLYEEPGAAPVQDLLTSGDDEVLVSSVNLCEVATKLVRHGAMASKVAMSIRPFVNLVVEFGFGQALFAGELSRKTSHLGLSLGDRACLALAASRGAVAWTTDAAWTWLDVGVIVKLLCDC